MDEDKCKEIAIYSCPVLSSPTFPYLVNNS
jgi:hypothetical protein